MREELLFSPNVDERAALFLAVGREMIGIDTLLGLGVIAVPAQDLMPRAPYQDVGQQRRQRPFPILYQLEVVPQMWGIDRQVCSISHMEKLNLMIDIHGALVARCCSQ